MATSPDGNPPIPIRPLPIPAGGGYESAGSAPGALGAGAMIPRSKRPRVNFVEVLGPADRHLSSLMQIAVLVFIACYGLVSLQEILVGKQCRKG